MQPTPPAPHATPASLAESAKGWHSIQLAVMGFIGFCGILRMGDDPAGPSWLTWGSTGMSILALLTAVTSTWMVGSVAYPTYGFNAEMPADAPGRLRGGIRMTFVSVIMMAIAGATGWWPSSAQNLEAHDQAGHVVCGSHVDGAPDGQLWLKTDSGVITIQISAIADIKPVDNCA